MEAILVQPRHTYAPAICEERLGHVYMPTSLLSAAARFLSAGIQVRIVDENIGRSEPYGDALGVNLVGPPYVEQAREVVARYRKRNPSGPVLLGGQVISGFGAGQLTNLFGKGVVDGNNPSALGKALGLEPSCLPAPEDTSLIPAYDTISEDSWKLYLSEEFAFYLSQGCRYSCNFCGADRTRRLPDGRTAVVREVYRKLPVIESDLRYLLHRAQQTGRDVLSLYLSNLDLFQSPEALGGFAATVRRIRKEFSEVSLRMRGLSNVESFLAVHETCPWVIGGLVEAGLYRVGFGIDGATPKVWAAIRKPHRGRGCVDAIRIAREEYGLTPETLMVFGHADADDEASLDAACNFGKDMYERYGSLPRPHVAKGVIPGNDGWRAPSNKSVVEELLKNPRTFQLLDFTALPSRLTHRNEGFRHLVSKYFIRMCQLKGCVTQYVLPEDPELAPHELEKARIFNLRRYDL